jgi:hypothetical protein
MVNPTIEPAEQLLLDHPRNVQRLSAPPRTRLAGVGCGRLKAVEDSQLRAMVEVAPHHVTKQRAGHRCFPSVTPTISRLPPIGDSRVDLTSRHISKSLISFSADPDTMRDRQVTMMDVITARSF